MKVDRVNIYSTDSSRRPHLFPFIFFQAHNIEDACRESATFIITKYNVDAAITEFQKSVQSTTSDFNCESIAYFGKLVCYVILKMTCLHESKIYFHSY